MFEFINSNTIKLEKLTGTVIYLVADTLGKLESYDTLSKVCDVSEFECDAEKLVCVYAPYGFDAQKMIIASIGDGHDRAKNENTGGIVFDKLYRGHKNAVSLVVSSGHSVCL